jgi:hypothetical protein
LQIQSTTENKNSTNVSDEGKKDEKNQENTVNNFVPANSKYKVTVSQEEINEYLVKKI